MHVSGMRTKRAIRPGSGKIIIYTEAFLPNVGGGENYCADLAEVLTEKGQSVTVVTPIKSSTKDDFKFKVLRMRHPVFLGFNINFIEPILLIIKERPALVHFSGPAISDFIMIPLLKIIGFPIVLTFHGQFNNKYARNIMRILAPMVYRFTDKIIVETSRDKIYLNKLKVPENKMELFFYDGVKREKYKCETLRAPVSILGTEKPIRFIFVGALSSSRPYKGYNLLLDLFVNINRAEIFPTPVLTIVGGGDMYMPLQEKAKDLKNVHFTGFLKDEELIKAICSSDILILPSMSDGEGLGKVVFEAVSCGKPALVSKFAGAAELIRRYDAGIVFDPYDMTEAIKIIRMLNLNRDLLTEFSRNGERMMAGEGLDLVSTTERHMKVYEEAYTKS